MGSRKRGRTALFPVRLRYRGNSVYTIRRIRPFHLLATLAVPLILQAQAIAEDTARKTRDVVEAREIAFAKTMADRDLDAFATFISPEAVFFDGRQQPLRGRAAIVAAWARFFDGPVAPFAWHPDIVEPLESGELALSSGPVYAPDGEVTGRFNSVWRKDPDGTWRVVFDKGS
ncbi:MAG: DUF4440 domain-containing protein [Gammaproteobacteria bacterium]|nr:DUF4440 domain-containing protein [Gammaproteobacteria bacterium]